MAMFRCTQGSGKHIGAVRVHNGVTRCGFCGNTVPAEREEEYTLDGMLSKVIWYTSEHHYYVATRRVVPLDYDPEEIPF